jgi:hypothetical protein
MIMSFSMAAIHFIFLPGPADLLTVHIRVFILGAAVAYLP